MKKLLKPLIALALATVVVLSLVACGETVGLKENNEWNNAISEYNRKKELAHPELISYESEQAAINAVIKDSANYMSLNGTWDFALATKATDVAADFMKTEYVYPDPDKAIASPNGPAILDWDTITVPGSWELQGYDVPMYTDNTRYPWANDITPAKTSQTYLPVGMYRKTVDIPAEWDGREVFINFEGVSSAFYVYVNGAMVGYAEGSYTSSEFLLTPYLNAGESNLIAVKVYKFADSSWIEATDSLKLGGITRDVYLYTTPETRIRDINIETTLDSSFENALLNFNVSVASYTDKSEKDMKVKVTVYDEDGNVFIKETPLSSSVAFDVNKTADSYYAGKIGGRVSAIAPNLWNAENPYRYTVVAKLFNAAGEVVDITSLKFGIMSSGFLTDDEGHQTLAINGTPVTLYGINYNEHDPDTGSTLSYETLLADVKLMKELNINAIRSPGRPLSIDMLELCDEYGIYVIDDISISSNPYSNKEDQSIPGSQSIWQAVSLDRLIGVVNRDKNHPSVIVWSLGTDSGVGTNFDSLRSYLISTDSRLLIYDDYADVSDMMVSLDWDITQIREYLDNNSNRKPLIFQSDDLGYLNGAGNLATWVELCMNYGRAQGGFLANWIDYAIYTPIEGTMRDAKVNTPVKENPELYQLTYSGSWGEPIASGYSSLKGILNADRTLQSDAEEFRKAYAPVYVTPEDLSAGIFNITNRYNFNSIASTDFVIEYELMANDQVVLTGTVSDIELAPGQSTTFKVDYGTQTENTEYFINIKVTYTPDWANGEEVVMSSTQYEITEFKVMPKATPVTPSGAAFDYTFFVTPEVYTTAYDIVKNGAFYFTNNSDVDLNELYELSYVVYETNNTEKHIKQETGEVWETPGKIVYTHGKVENFSVPANTAYRKVNIDLPVKAVEGGLYSIELTVTAKQAIGEVPEGFSIRYVFNEATLGETIPFEIDPSRTPQPVLDAEGNPVTDATTMLKIMTGGDPIYVPVETPNFDEGLIFEEFDEFLTFDNGTVQLSINAENGLITKYAVNGVNIFAPNSNSPIGNFVRQPSGGDLISNVSSTENTSVLSTISRNTESKKLADDIKIEKISDDHYRLTVNYLIATYSYDVFSSGALNSDYTVTYDIYGDGTLVVGVAYSPSIFEGLLPYEVSSVISISGDFETVSWYGRGPGESYRDKLADTKMGIYEDYAIEDLIVDYLYATESSSREDVRWAVFEDANGNAFMLTSDTDTFALNVSKTYPWETPAYSRDKLGMNNTVVRVIADARGVNAGNIADAHYYSNVEHVNPGSSYAYSFKVVPMAASDDAKAKADEYVETVLPEVTATEITDGGVFALQNIADVSRYLTTKVNADGTVTVSLLAGTGTENQMWKQESDKTIGGYRLLNIGKNKYLTPIAGATPLGSVARDFALADKINVVWQLFNHDAKNEVTIVNSGDSLTAVEYNGTFDMGGRLAALLKQGKTSACWIYEPVDGTDDIYLMKNAKTGYYLTAVDAFTFRNPVIEGQYDRFSDYAPETDWSTYENIMNAKPMEAKDTYEFLLDTWGPTEGSVTTWQLLPGQAQRWQFVSVGENQYKMINHSTGNALAIVDGVLTEVASDAAQTWTAYQIEGLYGFVDQASGLALSTAVSGADVVIGIAQWNELPNQLWALSSEADLAIDIEAGNEWFTVQDE